MRQYTRLDLAFDVALRAATIALAIVALVVVYNFLRPYVAVAEKQCPAGSHAIWDPALKQALCGDGVGFTAKSQG